MSQSIDNKYDNSDEIDLGKLILRFARVTKKNIIILIIFFVLGVSGSITYFFISPPIYQSNMIVSSGVLTEANARILIQTIQKLIEENNNSLASKKLAISPQYINDIKSLEIETIKEDIEQTKDVHVYQIKIKVTNNNILDSLEKGIIYYFTNNQYISEKTKIEKENLQTLISLIQKEIKGMQSLKDSLKSGIIVDHRGSNMVMLDPANIYKESLALYKEEADLKEKLKFIEGIQVIEGFTKFNKPTNLSLAVTTIFGVIISIFFAYIVIGVKEINAFLKKQKL